MNLNKFLLLNKQDNTMIDEFKSNTFYPTKEIGQAVNKFWDEQEVIKVEVTDYISDVSRMTDGKVILSKDTVEFYLIQISDNDY